MFFISIDYSRCDGCAKCMEYCPKAVFTFEDSRPILSAADNCSGCMSCEEICPLDCIEVKEF